VDDAALSERVIGCAIEVHRHLGPGLLEGVYEDCLCHELQQNGLGYQRQVHLPVVYKGVQLESAYRLDILVQNRLVIEIKAIDRILSIHEAQLLTYLRVSGHRTGLTLNFNHAVLKDGIRRMVL
jgi:GxxExxY protein